MNTSQRIHLSQDKPKVARIPITQQCSQDGPNSTRGRQMEQSQNEEDELNLTGKRLQDICQRVQEITADAALLKAEIAMAMDPIEVLESVSEVEELLKKDCPVADLDNDSVSSVSLDSDNMSNSEAENILIDEDELDVQILESFPAPLK